MERRRTSDPVGPDPYVVMARFYDADYAAADGDADVAFYSSLAAEMGEPVLEMGCGSGRNLLPIARSGIAIHGIDSSPAMLSLLRENLAREFPEVRRRVALTQGDIRSARVGDRYGLVTAPFRVAQHLIRLDDRREWLRNVVGHLKPAGVLCFDVLRPDPDLLARPRGESRAIERPIPGTNRVVIRSVSTRPGADPGTLEVGYTWRITSEGGEPVSEWRAHLAHHLYTRSEIEALLDEQGFEIRAHWGSFRRDPPGPDSTDHVIVAGLRSR